MTASGQFAFSLCNQLSGMLPEVGRKPWLAFAAIMLGACGSDDEAESQTGSNDTSRGQTDGATGGSDTSASTSAAATSSTGSTGVSSDTGPKIDVGAETSDGSGSVSIYEACTRTSDCMDGLECNLIGLGDTLISHCTITCPDSMVCPNAPQGGDVGCVPDPGGGADQCAILCDADGMCPSGYTCWNAAAELSPCVPQ